MKKKPRLTTEAGGPVADNQHSQTAGPGGPVLLQDHYLIGKLARFNRERIPEMAAYELHHNTQSEIKIRTSIA